MLLKAHKLDVYHGVTLSHFREGNIVCTGGCAVSSNVYILVLAGEVSAHIELDLF